MKVLQVITSLNIGGAERLLTESTPIYQKKGIEMDVLVLSDANSSFREELEKTTNGKLIFLTNKSVYNPLLILKIKRYINKYDIIHAHLFPVLYWVVFAKLISRCKVPIVYTEHSTTNRRRESAIFQSIERFVYKRLSLIGCISNGVMREIKAKINVNLNVKLIENGINLAKFEEKISIQKLSEVFNKESFYLMQVSSMRVEKDQLTIIRALVQLPKRIKLVLVGDGPLRSFLEDQAELLSVHDRVIFLGNRDDVPKLLGLSDIVILSSKVEGFGLAIVEGMAAGKPVIASDIIGLSEIVKGFGLLFSQGDVDALKDQILKLYEDQAFYTAVSKKCKIRSSDFSIDKMVNQYIMEYELLNR